MTSDFDRALDAARGRERASASSQAQRAEWAARAAEEGYTRLLEIGRQAFNALTRGGCEEFALVESDIKRAVNVGIKIDSENDGDGYITDLYVCRDGRFYAGPTHLLQIDANKRWFSNEPKDRRIDDRRVLQIHYADWVGVSIRDSVNSAPLASFPSSGSSSYYVYRSSTSEELMTWGFGFPRSTGPLIEDVAGRVARIVNRRASS